MVHVVVAPGGLDVPVRGIVLHDIAEEVRTGAGKIVLGIGVDSRTQLGIQLTRDAASAGAAAVMVKEHGQPPPTLVETARDAGIALLAISPEAEWGQIYSLLRTAEATAGGPSDPALGGVAVGDLFTLANATAAMCGAAITIEDVRSNVLAHSTGEAPIDAPRRQTILGRAVPRPWTQRLNETGVFRRLWASDEPIHVELSEFGDIHERVAIAVRAGDQILGSIWAVQGERPLDADAERALQSAARIAALHLVRHYARDELRRRRDGDTLRGVLSGHLPPDELINAGLSAADHVTVLAFEPVTDDQAEATMRAERIEGLVAVYLEAFRHDAVCAAVDGRIYVVVSHRKVPEPPQLRRMAAAIADNAERGHSVQVRAAIGSTVSEVRDLVASRTQADRILRALGETDHLTVAAVEDVRNLVILDQLRDLATREPALLSGRIDRLLEHDRDGDKQYVPTVRTYLDAFGDATRGAALLGVHPNTYRYRLRRAVELAELDLEDPLERLVLHLQLHILESGKADAERDRQS